MMLTLHLTSLPLFAQPGTWEYYKTAFISNDGRVIDYYQEQCSHSEGQGYGMLLAVRHDDKETFSNLYHWTVSNLMVRKDGLAAWKWGRRITGTWGIIDYNNATDGDILIAWACLIAGEKWKDSTYIEFARNIVECIKAHLILERNGKKILLPGYFGFDTDSKVRLNPSYFVFPAFEAFVTIKDREFWVSLGRDCREIIASSSFTRFRLPADWVYLDVGGKISIDDPQHGYFQYEAIRVPLYLSMGSDKNALSAFSDYLHFSQRLGYLPLSVNLLEEQVSLKEAPAGFYAVMSQCARFINLPAISSDLMATADRKIQMEKKDYYSTTLYLMAKTMDMP